MRSSISSSGKINPFFVHLEHFAVHDPIQGRKDLVAKYEAKRRGTIAHGRAELSFGAQPGWSAPSPEALKALQTNDTLQAHQDQRVWWVKQVQDNAQFAAMLEATDESLGEGSEPSSRTGTGGEHHPHFYGRQRWDVCFQSIPRGASPPRGARSPLCLFQLAFAGARGGTTRGICALPDRALAWSSQGRKHFSGHGHWHRLLPHSAGDDRSPTGFPISIWMGRASRQPCSGKPMIVGPSSGTSSLQQPRLSKPGRGHPPGRLQAPRIL